SRPGRGAWRGLDDVDASIQAIAFEAAEEERLVPGDWPAERTTELILPEERFAQAGHPVEVVRGIERVAAKILEGGPMEVVGARFRDHADLTATARPEFGRIRARLDPELLHVLETRLQLEWCRDFAVQVA